MSRKTALLCLFGCGGPDDTDDRRAPQSTAETGLPTTDSPPDTSSPPRDPVNVVVVLLDDFGQEQVDGIGLEATTPMFDSLAAAGVTFTHAWGAPACSQARAALLSGQYTIRYDLGEPLGIGSDWTWPDEVELLPEQLALAGLSSYAVGKWHLGHDSSSGEPAPVVPGFTDYALNLGTLGAEFSVTASAMSYLKWEEFGPGSSTVVQGTYNTSAIVDHALARIPTLPEPWFAYLAFNAPHRPLHRPPKELWRTPETADVDDQVEEFHWMTEAVDSEVERFAAMLDPAVLARTVFIVTADNGTSDKDIDPALSDRAKGTVYETGVNVPMIISGPGIVRPGRSSNAHVNLVDLRPTIADLMGAGPTVGSDGASLVPLLADAATAVRTYDFVTKFDEQPCLWMRAIRDERYKAIEIGSEMYGVFHELYDLETDPGELDDLLSHPALTADEARHADALGIEQQVILATSSTPPCGG